MQCIARGKADSGCQSVLSPLAEVEEKFVYIILCLSNIRWPVSVSETICLIQSLIQNTPAQKKFIDFLCKLYHARGYTNIPTSSLGKISCSYYYSFMKRFCAIVDSNKDKRSRASSQFFLNMISQYKFK